MAASVHRSVRPSIAPPAPALHSTSQQARKGSGLRPHLTTLPTATSQGGTGARGAGKKKRQQNILISHISFYLSPGDSRWQRAAVPMSLAAPGKKQRGFQSAGPSGTGRMPSSKRKARGGREIRYLSPPPQGAGRVGSLGTLNSDQRVGCAASPCPAVRRWHPWGGWPGTGKRCSVRQCAAVASCRQAG